MENVKLYLTNNCYDGKLDMFAIRKVQSELKKRNVNLNINNIFKQISELNMDCIAEIVVQTIRRCNKEITAEKLIYEIETFELSNVFDYINRLLEEYMPLKNKPSKNIDCEFEDLDTNNSSEDWDFDFMEYLWYSVLKRSDDFWSTSPKTFFSQIEIHKKVNGGKNAVEKIDYI